MALHRIHRVTSSPYNDPLQPTNADEKQLNDLLKQGWVIKDMKVVTLEGGNNRHTNYDTIYWLHALHEHHEKKLLEAWKAEAEK